jgi:hypothetical protein
MGPWRKRLIESPMKSVARGRETPLYQVGAAVEGCSMALFARVGYQVLSTR